MSRTRLPATRLIGSAALAALIALTTLQSGCAVPFDAPLGRYQGTTQGLAQGTMQGQSQAQSQGWIDTPTLADAGIRGTASVTVNVRPIQVSPRVWMVRGDLGPVSLENQGFNSNAAFVVTPAGVVVFDVLGTPVLGHELLRQIRHITPLPIRHVIISHWHADHFYGLQAFKAAGATIWAHRAGQAYLASEAPLARLAERRRSLSPWVNDSARLISADRWIDTDTRFELGGMRFALLPAGPAHTSEDLMLWVESEGVMLAGDLMFGARIPFVGDALTRGWLEGIEQLARFPIRVLVGGHGEASVQPARDLALTRDYLRFLRDRMGKAVAELETFDEAYRNTDWSAFADKPAFQAANRANAYNVFLEMEREALGK
jgi:glyoxylase-like metal-dependent hydrolase (beta-lactamase superfamily II)